MFGSKSNTTTGTTATTNSGGILSRLRNRSTTKKPTYTTSSRNTNSTGLGSSRTGTTGVKKNKMFQKRSVGTGPAPMSRHKQKATLSQKVHGATTVMSGKMHNNHREVVAGEREMHGQNARFGGIGGSKSTTGTGRV